jgi:hypothetical protein
MLPSQSLPERGAMPDRPGGRGQSTRPTRQGQNADEVRAARHRKKLVPSGPPPPDHSREHFSAVARATRTARRTAAAVLRDPTAGSPQAHAIDGNAEEGRRWSVRGSTSLRHIRSGARHG